MSDYSEDQVTTEWVAEPKTVPPELTPEYEHADYIPPKRVEWSSIGDQLDSATKEQLMALMRGGIGDV